QRRAGLLRDGRQARAQIAVCRHTARDHERSGLAVAFGKARQGAPATVGEVLADRSANALERFQDSGPGGPLVVAGGVAANRALRARLAKAAEAAGTRMIAPPAWLCTDNAAMIAWAGLERLALGLTDGFDFAPRPRWPLEALEALESLESGAEGENAA
ncbi:MAG: hypothetical protein R3285_00790, partial [Kiloniellales bacterium]|nr:hypothetical protein [Kiloniellales bacterium]